MRALPRHQEQLLHHLQGLPRPWDILISAPIGVGLGEILVRLVANACSQGESVVVLTERRVMADQWVSRLHQASIDYVVELTSSSDVLMILDRGRPYLHDSQVLVTTAARLLHGPGRRLSDALEPSLLIVERMAGLAKGIQRDLADGLASRSESKVILTDTDAPPWFHPSETIRWSLKDVFNDLPPISVLSYQSSPREVEIFNRALDVLAQGSRLGRRAQTRPGLQANILQLIGRLSEESFDVENDYDESGPVWRDKESIDARLLLEEAWAVLDSLDELEEDSRLRAADSIVERAVDEHRPCIVMTESSAEAEYVAAHLGMNNGSVSLLTGATPVSERHDALARVAEGGVLVATSLALNFIFALPRRALILWWSLPHGSAHVEEWLARGAKSPDSMTIAMLANPPLPGEIELHATLKKIKG